MATELPTEAIRVYSRETQEQRLEIHHGNPGQGRLNYRLLSRQNRTNLGVDSEHK